jgi:hypothetical protein
LRRALAAWQRRPETAHLALQTEVLLAIRAGERKSLRRFARQWDGRFYLFVPKFITWENAKSFCGELGGRLVEIHDPRCQGLLESTFVVGCWAWMGLERTPDGLKWLSGHPVVYTNFGDSAHAQAPGPKVFAKQWMSEYDPGAENTFIVEWPGEK